MALNIKPLGDRVLVEAVEEKEVKKGGIIIPDTASRIVAMSFCEPRSCRLQLSS